MPETSKIASILVTLSKNLSSHQDQQINQLLAHGWRLIEKEKYSVAFELFDEAFSANNLCEAAFIGMSISQLALKNFSASLKLLNQAYTLNKMLNDSASTALYETAILWLTEIKVNEDKARDVFKGEQGKNLALSEQLFPSDPKFRSRYPLILDEVKVCILITPKCACTTVTRWALHHLGLLGAANQYSQWPHDFRVQVLYQSAAYKTIIDSFVFKDYTYYQVIRNPYRRLLSSFCHFGLRQQLLKQAGFYGDTVSFKEFATAMCKDMDLSINDHVRPQYTKQVANIEKAIKITRIKIEDGLENAFSDIERIHNLPLAMPKKKKESIGRSYHHASYTANLPDSETAVNHKIDFNYRGSFAPSASYFDYELYDLIYECYELDFLNFGYRHGEP